MHTWVDENTGRTVRQLTSFPKGAKFPYFRVPRNLPDGRIVVYLKHEHGSRAAVDVESGDIQMIPHERGTLLRFRESDGCAWFYDKETREVLERGLLEGTSRVIGRLDPSVQGDVHDITCDGRTLIGANCECEPSNSDGLHTGNHQDLWRWIYRRRSGTMWSYDLVENRCREILQTPR